VRGTGTDVGQGWWRLLVPPAAAGVGLLLATSAATAAGTDLRSDRRVALADLVAAQEARLAAADERARSLRAELTDRQEAARAADDRVAAAVATARTLEPGLGLSALAGPGVTVVLDDAPRPRDGQVPPSGASPDDLVVHEQDVQAVVNALRAGGADGIAVMGERLTATSSVRCVGNTLLLHGQVFSPPFEITAVGDVEALRGSLAAAPGVQTYLTYVTAYGLGWSVREHPRVELPAHDGPLELTAVAP